MHDVYGNARVHRTRVLCISLFAGIKYPLARGFRRRAPVNTCRATLRSHIVVFREEKKGRHDSTRVCAYIQPSITFHPCPVRRRALFEYALP